MLAEGIDIRTNLNRLFVFKLAFFICDWYKKLRGGLKWEQPPLNPFY